MWSVFDDIAKESEEKGRREGEAKGRKEGEAKGRAIGIIETGFEFGLSESDILSRLQKKLDVSLQMAQEYLRMFEKQTI